VRYFITFSCHGAHLHGDDSGSVDRDHNIHGSPLVATNRNMAASERTAMGEAAYWLDRRSRGTALEAMKKVCTHRHWTLLAAHVRTHNRGGRRGAREDLERLQVLRQSEAKCAWARRADQKRWACHGSTLWLWTDNEVRNAIKYVVDGQGSRGSERIAVLRRISVSQKISVSLRLKVSKGFRSIPVSEQFLSRREFLIRHRIPASHRIPVIVL
jgi:hypothetical protein